MMKEITTRHSDTPHTELQVATNKSKADLTDSLIDIKLMWTRSKPEDPENSPGLQVATNHMAPASTSAASKSLVIHPSGRRYSKQTTSTSTTITPRASTAIENPEKAHIIHPSGRRCSTQNMGQIPTTAKTDQSINEAVTGLLLLNTTDNSLENKLRKNAELVPVGAPL